jgi:Na+/H+ antiporter NhaD/arsenite permease-like protein
MPDLPAAAYVSLGALALVLVVSVLRESLNPGLLSVALAVLLGTLGLEMEVTRTFALFPSELFLTLAGLTFFVAIAHVNGTMGKLTAHAVRLVGRRTALVPVILYLLVTAVTMLGPGNIAATALLAPSAMALAARIGLGGFLMTLLIVGAANGAGLSPFAPTGVISTSIVTRLGLDVGDPVSLAWRVHWNSELLQGLVNIGGFLVLGGFAWMRRQRRERLDLDAVAPRPEAFDGRQRLTLGALAVFAVLVLLPGLPGLRDVLPGALRDLASNVGAVAFALAALLALLGAGNVEAAIRSMPWPVILMVTGVTLLVGVIEKAGGTRALVHWLGAISTPESVTFWLALLAGVVSAYSSSSGVVIPLFLPLVPGILREHGGGDPEALISTINVGAHLVDTSPLSTLGAMCLAFAAPEEDRARLYRRLLGWGLSMSVIGALVCWLFFGAL